MRVIATFLLVVATALAHHSTAQFDMTKDVRISGKVLEFAWMNPHSYIVLDVKGTPWKMEAEALNLLRRNGWTKDTLKAGDEITCIGARAKDPEVHAMKCFTVEFKDGRKPMVATPVGISGKQPTDLR